MLATLEMSSTIRQTLICNLTDRISTTKMILWDPLMSDIIINSVSIGITSMMDPFSFFISRNLFE